MIQDNNGSKAVGSQVEFRPNDKNLITWDTYVGQNKTSVSPDFRMRYFTDLYWIYKHSEKFDATACAYIGMQKRERSSPIYWWIANLIGRYHFSSALSLSGRLE